MWKRHAPFLKTLDHRRHIVRMGVPRLKCFKTKSQANNQQHQRERPAHIAFCRTECCKTWTASDESFMENSGWFRAERILLSSQSRGATIKLRYFVETRPSVG